MEYWCMQQLTLLPLISLLMFTAGRIVTSPHGDEFVFHKYYFPSIMKMAELK